MKIVDFTPIVLFRHTSGENNHEISWSGESKIVAIVLLRIITFLTHEKQVIDKQTSLTFATRAECESVAIIPIFLRLSNKELYCYKCSLFINSNKKANKLSFGYFIQ